MVDIVSPKEFHIKGRVKGFDLSLATTWGLFSYKEIDVGTKFTAESVPVSQDDICLDLACGYGVIGLAIGKIAVNGHVHFLDRDFIALRYAERNAKLNGVDNSSFILSNGFESIEDGLKFDKIVGYLPSHVSNDMLNWMIEESTKYLKPGGSFYISGVKNLQNSYKKMFMKHYGNYETLKTTKMHFVGESKLHV